MSDRDPWQHRSKEMRCKTCMFYVPKVPIDHLVGTPEVCVERNVGELPAGAETILGRCRRNAPTMKGYPVVFETDWCGEHKLDENKV